MPQMSTAREGRRDPKDGQRPRDSVGNRVEWGKGKIIQASTSTTGCRKEGHFLDSWGCDGQERTSRVSHRHTRKLDSKWVVGHQGYGPAFAPTVRANRN
jgi:hypothetical protein